LREGHAALDQSGSVFVPEIVPVQIDPMEHLMAIAREGLVRALLPLRFMTVGTEDRVEIASLDFDIVDRYRSTIYICGWLVRVASPGSVGPSTSDIDIDSRPEPVGATFIEFRSWEH